jgi:hypothetical protein
MICITLNFSELGRFTETPAVDLTPPPASEFTSNVSRMAKRFNYVFFFNEKWVSLASLSGD